MELKTCASFGVVFWAIIASACGASPDSPPAGAGETSGGPAPFTPSSTSDGYVAVPGGLLVHSSCVHELAPGESLRSGNEVVVNGELVRKLPECGHPLIRRSEATHPLDETVLEMGLKPAPVAEAATLYGQYAEASYQVAKGGADYKDWYTSITTTLTVPPAPQNTGGFDSGTQVIFLWSGLVSRNGHAVLQPVLQFGRVNTGSGLRCIFHPGDCYMGGQYWAMGSWYVNTDNGTTVHTGVTRVNPGDAIEFDVAQANASSCAGDGSGCWWDIWSNINGSPTAPNQLIQTPGVGFNQAFGGVMELWGQYPGCTSFPNTTYSLFQTIGLSQGGGTMLSPFWNFTNVNVTPNMVVWPASDQSNLPPNCGLTTQVVAASGTTIAY